ncbi:MAG: tRNA glutamyl-Q(34) synthetase GluQRS [Verrucomicrobiae bacterium]|nr:tRNA glutamyl-Q(34) synthetase GluQRS [Verrucomicrobiae bacterium]
MNPPPQTSIPAYRGRLAPSPTGYLHLGHARTFWVAQQRAEQNGGELILRNDDLDSTRYQMEFVDAMLEDLRWFGFEWSEGPDIGGPFAPYNQSERMSFYQAALEKLRVGNFIYPCTCSRKDIQQAVTAPHAADDELIYPGTCRAKGDEWRVAGGKPEDATPPGTRHAALRFRVPDGETVSFHDQNLGLQTFVAGKDFGDFVVWRGDGVPAYQLSCAVDDAAMRISEVVRGADLLVSTARQILIYRALGLAPPQFFHCELMLDDQGQRLAKRHDALSLRTLRGQGSTPTELRSRWLSAGRGG